MPEEERLTTKEYWTSEDPCFSFQRHTDHEIDVLIKKYIPRTNHGSCLEIGSFPGPFLTTFGDLGYRLNGIDFHPKNEKDLPAWLSSQGFTTSEFRTIDFFKYDTAKKYDVVASFGFIEHFKDFREVILKHISLVNNNGYLVITTPNFKGWIQQWLHRTFDKNNLKLHNLESMQPKVWATIMKANGFEVIYTGYFGGFQFWKANEKMNVIKRTSFWFIVRIIPLLCKILRFESKAFSAYCGVIGRKVA